VFTRPRKRSILIFDTKNSACLYGYLDESKVTSFDPLAIRLNIYILFQSLILRTPYYQSYVDCVKPELLLTFRLMYLDQGKATSGILCSDYIRNELTFLRWLFDYSEKEQIPLTILGKLDQGHEKEENFFSNLSNGVNFSYLRNYPERGTYKIIDQAEFIVSIDSSLGYEALSRGKKVAIFPGIRGGSYPLNTRNFCWPSKQVKNTGFFWTNSVDLDQWNKVLKYITNIDDREWHDNCNKYINQSIVVDRSNSKPILLLDKMGLSK
jgi:surface carbohydrate biosynthesis protein